MCDNCATISISENLMQFDWTTHVEVDRRFIKNKLENKIIVQPFVRSKDQLAYIITNAVNGRSFKDVLYKLNICDPTIQVEVEC